MLVSCIGIFLLVAALRVCLTTASSLPMIFSRLFEFCFFFVVVIVIAVVGGCGNLTSVPTEPTLFIDVVEMDHWWLLLLLLPLILELVLTDFCNNLLLALADFCNNLLLALADFLMEESVLLLERQNAMRHDGECMLHSIIHLIKSDSPKIVELLAHPHS